MKHTVIAVAVGVCMLLGMDYSRASDCKYNMTLASKHLYIDNPKTGKYQYHNLNEKNYGVGVECDDVQAGIYHNSLSRPSVYLGYVRPGNEYFGIKYGVVTGYNIPLVPYLAGYIKVYKFELTIIPVTPVNPTTIGLTYWF